MKNYILFLFVLVCGSVFGQENSVETTVTDDQMIAADLTSVKTVSGQDVRVFIAKNFQYPEEALSDEISGTIVAEFIVEKDGSVQNVTIVNKVCKACDAKVVRVIKSAKYQVLKINNEPQRVRYRIPVRMVLE